jgi:hypothetical protein
MNVAPCPATSLVDNDRQPLRRHTHDEPVGGWRRSGAASEVKMSWFRNSTATRASGLPFGALISAISTTAKAGPMLVALEIECSP